MKKHLINFPENNISIESFYDRLDLATTASCSSVTGFWLPR